MKCYAVIDTNVLVSALLSKDEKSATVQVLERVLNKEIRTKKSYLVTGNIKHFPKRDYIVSPRQLIDILENKS